LTARVTAKNLEVRSPLRLVGPALPLHLLVLPVLAGLGGCVALWGLTWLSRRALGFIRHTKDLPPSPLTGGTREYQATVLGDDPKSPYVRHLG
jgi:hypothetical protein